MKSDVFWGSFVCCHKPALNYAETVFAQPTQDGCFRLGSVGRFFSSLLDSPLVWEFAGWCLTWDALAGMTAQVFSTVSHVCLQANWACLHGPTEL